MFFFSECEAAKFVGPCSVLLAVIVSIIAVLRVHQRTVLFRRHSTMSAHASVTSLPTTRWSKVINLLLSVITTTSTHA